jgi:hypothetical protein
MWRTIPVVVTPRGERVADLIACLAPMASDPGVRPCGLTCELSSALPFLTL